MEKMAIFEADFWSLKFAQINRISHKDTKARRRKDYRIQNSGDRMKNSNNQDTMTKK
jgi:hypothetical protein